MELILQKVKDILNKFFTDNKTYNLLLALSGGKDSMTLLDILTKIQQEYNFNLYCIYINHNLRGQESHIEEQFIKKISIEKRLKISIRKINKKFWGNLQNESIEMAARRIRYKIFKNISTQYNIDYILTAHHFNDRIETFFLQILRGGGIETLSSIPLKNKNIIRPMLFVTRKEIDSYIKKNNISYLEDSTNQQNIYERNKVRNLLLPVLDKIKPNWKKSFKYIFEYLDEENSFFNHLLSSILSQMIIFKSKNIFCINKTMFDKKSFFIKKKIVKKLLKFLHFPIKPSYPFFKIFNNTKKIKYSSKRFIVESKSKYLWFVKIIDSSFSTLINTLPSSFIYDNNNFSVYTHDNISNPKKHFCFTNKDSLFPFTIQTLRQNDYNLTINKKKIINILKKSNLIQDLYEKVLILKSHDNCIIGLLYHTFKMVNKDYYVKNNHCIIIE